jgi:hypothetical protein
VGDGFNERDKKLTFALTALMQVLKDLLVAQTEANELQVVSNELVTQLLELQKPKEPTPDEPPTETGSST